ncbi:MAG: hypothetical protein ACLR7Z_17095 [Bilophila wadsworthia]
MDGLDTAREIRRRVGPDLPIIMLSGYDCSDVRRISSLRAWTSSS